MLNHGIQFVLLCSFPKRSVAPQRREYFLRVQSESGLITSVKMKPLSRWDPLLIAVPTLSDSSLQNCFQTVASAYYTHALLCTFIHRQVNDTLPSEDALFNIKICKTIFFLSSRLAEQSSQTFKTLIPTWGPLG